MTPSARPPTNKSDRLGNTSTTVGAATTVRDWKHVGSSRGWVRISGTTSRRTRRCDAWPRPRSPAASAGAAAESVRASQHLPCGSDRTADRCRAMDVLRGSEPARPRHARHAGGLPGRPLRRRHQSRGSRPASGRGRRRRVRRGGTSSLPAPGRRRAGPRRRGLVRRGSRPRLPGWRDDGRRR